MIYPIKLYGDPDLQKISHAVTPNYPNLQQLIADMFETMHKARGIGLSAIQIGIPINLFVIEASLPDENFHFKEVFINPVITKFSSEKVQHLEGCLSIPGLTGFVNRPESISIKYYDANWKKTKAKFADRESRIIQHEYEHLMGQLYTDSLAPMWKEVFREPLKMIKERKISTEFLSK